jgi:hypothetical protein
MASPIVWLGLGLVSYVAVNHLLLGKAQAQGPTPSTPTVPPSGLGKEEALKRFTAMLIASGEPVHIVDYAAENTLKNSPGFYIRRNSIGADQVFKAIHRGAAADASGMYILKYDQQQTLLLNYMATGSNSTANIPVNVSL